MLFLATSLLLLTGDSGMEEIKTCTNNHIRTVHEYGIQSSGDTVLFDIQAGNMNAYVVDIPIRLTGSGNTSSIDFAFRLKHGVEFDSIINLLQGLNYLYYLNPNDSVMRFTSNSISQIPHDSTLMVLRINSYYGQLCATDFDSLITYINGDECNYLLNGCVFTANPSEPTELKHPAVYPNPAKDDIYISGISDQTDVRLINSIGEIITAEKINTDYQIHIEKLPRGIYFLILSSDKNNFQKTSKIIVQ